MDQLKSMKPGWCKSGGAPVRRSLPINMSLTMSLSDLSSRAVRGSEAVWKPIKLYPDPPSREPGALHSEADAVPPGGVGADYCGDRSASGAVSKDLGTDRSVGA